MVTQTAPHYFHRRWEIFPGSFWHSVPVIEDTKDGKDLRDGQRVMDRASLASFVSLLSLMPPLLEAFFPPYAAFSAEQADF